MVSGRSYHTATVLADGTVLVAGGYSGGSLSSAEIYDPKSGTFSVTGSMAVSRYFHTATVLADGTVLVAGGSSGSGSLASAEIYDPKSGTSHPPARWRSHVTSTRPRCSLTGPCW